MTMKRMIAFALTALLAVAGTLMITASPAAAAAPSNCANSSVCGYDLSQFNGTSGNYEWVTGTAGSCQPVGLNDKWTSVYNNAGRTIRLYRDANCGDGVWTLTSGDSLRNMGLYQPSWNNKITSVRFS